MAGTAAFATASPAMLWLIWLLPATITLAGLLGWREREPGNRRLTAYGGLLSLWLWLPAMAGQLELRQVSAMGSALAWLGLISFWAKHVWTHRPTPVWAHALVIAHLAALVIATLLSMLRAA